MDSVADASPTDTSIVIDPGARRLLATMALILVLGVAAGWGVAFTRVSVAAERLRLGDTERAGEIRDLGRKIDDINARLTGISNRIHLLASRNEREMFVE